jgi:hypothetical protein
MTRYHLTDRELSTLKSFSLVSLLPFISPVANWPDPQRFQRAVSTVFILGRVALTYSRSVNIV